MAHPTQHNEELAHAAGLLRTALEILDRTGSSVAALHVATAVEALSQAGTDMSLRHRPLGR